MILSERLKANLSTISGGSADPVVLSAEEDSYDFAGTGPTYTYTSQNFGTAYSDRIIVACIAVDNFSQRVVSSCTIGGVSATEACGLNDPSNYTYSGIWYAAVPSGTSGTVSFTCDGTASGSALVLYNISSLNSSTPFDTSTSSNSTGTTLTNTISLPEEGCAIYMSTIGDDTATYSWSGATEYVDRELDGFFWYSSAYKDNSSGSADTTYDVTITYAVEPKCIAAASWR